MKKIYCIDTSSLIQAWERAYPQPNFPAFYKKMEELAADGRLITSEEVKHELAKKTDGVIKWVKTLDDGLFHPTDEEIQVKVAEILEKTALLGNQAQRNSADPFVVAVACIKNGVVVTQEDMGSEKKPKIPNACLAQKVECVKILDVIREEKWVF